MMYVRTQRQSQSHETAQIARPEDVIIVPSNGKLTALVAIVPLQLLAYEIAVEKGLNPDKPVSAASAPPACCDRCLTEALGQGCDCGLTTSSKSVCEQ
jgi:hypothetical protein